MAESSSSGEEDFKNETKYKQFAAAVERSLKGFEVSSEWHDLISSLARLNKTLLAYKQYPVVPSHIKVCKRLSQCLHPNLPSGVHLKALDVYKAIFNRVGTKGLSSNLLVYSSGLFPLLGYGAMSVRPVVLDIYERYYLALGQDLVPCLPGMVLGLLPGLEDESEHTERINNLMDALCLATDEPIFFSAVWQCVLTSPRGRLPAVCYVFSKLNKKATAEDQIQFLGGSLPVMVSALCVALLDRNVLVARVTLDIILILFPLHQPFLLPGDIIEILSSALETLLRRDMSLNRRLFSWLVGSQVGKSYMETHFPEVSRMEEQAVTVHSLYFQKFTKSFLLAALRRIISRAAQAVRHSTTRSDSILPYRLLRSLMDKPEIGDLIVSDVFLDITTCLRNQIESLGGVPVDPMTSLKLPHSSTKEGGSKKAGKKSHKAEVLQSANLFFSSLAPEQLWQWMESLLTETLSGAQVTQGSAVEQGNQRDDGAITNGVVEEDASEGLPSAGQGDDVTSSGFNSPELIRTESVQSISTRSPGHERKLSCASVCRLVQFLLQSLPLDAMEDVHTYHLPHLLWHLLHTLDRLEASTKPKHLRHFLELLLFSAHKLLEAPASRSGSTSATPIHTPATPTPISSLSLPKSHSGSLPPGEGMMVVTDKADSSALSSPMATAVATPTEELKLNIVTQFLAFFSKFVHNKVCFHDNHVNSAHLRTPQRELSDHVQKCFVSCCQLMCALAQMETSAATLEEALPTESTPPSWLSGLMSVCQGSHDHHMTFTAMETLLTLQASITPQPVLVGPEQSARNIISLLIPNISIFTRDDQFVEAVTHHLWSCLAPDLPLLHVEAATLLTWFNTLTLSPTCETVILREFASERVAVYQQFTVLWQYGPVVIRNTPSKPFSRAILRMVEGLQSHNTAIRCLVQAWLKFVTIRGDLHRLLQPLVRIITEQEGKRKIPPAPAADGSLVDDAGKYFYTPAGLNKEEVVPTQEEEILLIYTQVFDTDQVHYALSLLQAVLQVDPPAILSSLASSVVSVGAYAVDHMSDMSFSLPDQQATPTPQKSLLEIILLSLVAFLRSEYPESLEVSPSDWIENLRVKAAAVELVSSLVYHLYCVLASADPVGGASGSLVHNPSYVSALVTLCDVQKVLLLVLSQTVDHLKRGGSATGEKSQDLSPSEGSNGQDVTFRGTFKEVASLKRSSSQDESMMSMSVEVLFVHLLRCLQNFITLETLCIPSSPVAMTPSEKPIKKSLSKSHLIQPGLSTAAQPFFHSLLTDILTDPSLLVHHMPLLDMLCASLPNLHSQLEDLAPKILRQLCRNLETFVKSKSEKTEGATSEEGGWESMSGAEVMGYLQTLINVTLWCLFGEFPTQRVLLQHNLLNRFWDASQLRQMDDSEEAFSPTSKQPSTMSWLFGVFATSGQKAVSSPVGAKAPRLGLTSRVGHSILHILPAVYNALSEIWRWFSSGAAMTSGGGGGGGGGVGVGRRGRRVEGGLEVKKRRAEYEDVHSLVSSLLTPLALHESTAFFSSISTVWLEWDLGAKVNPSSKRISRKKDTFIVMLHHIKILPLEQFIRSVQFSFTDIAKFEDQESSVLRQKYLLHFFYKYISSSLQSSEELSACHPVLVMFLRDCYTKSYSGTTDSLLLNCHLLCMLTSILHVYICRVPGLEKKQKKERKELQDITHKLCEALSLAACSGLSRDTEQDFEVVETSDLKKTTMTSHLQETRAELPVTRDNTKLRTEIGEEVKGQTDTGKNIELTSHTPEAEAERGSQGRSEGRGKGGGEIRSSPAPQARPSTPKHLATSQKEISAGNVRAAILAPPHQPMVTMVATTGRQATQNSTTSAVDPSVLPGTQALAVLANTLSHFIDGVFGSSEKDRVLSLLKVVLHNIWPHLQNHSYETRRLYHHAVKLLSSLSGFQVTRKAWRRETFDLFMANNFFVMELDSLMEWKVLIDNLMTQDKTTFRDLLTKLVPGVGNIFTTPGQEALNTARLVKRMSFAILSAELDQYASYLPDIQEKLSECLKLHRHPIVSSEVFLGFRTLLLKFSSTHLMSFWPAIVAETLATLHQLESDLALELKDHKIAHRSKLLLYLSACKLLDTAWSLPTECLPHFQFLQWGFSDVSGPQSSTPNSEMGPVSRIRALFSTAVDSTNTSHQREAEAHLQRHNITSLRELQPFFMSLNTFPPSIAAGSTGGWKAGRNHQTLLSAAERALLQDFLEPFLSF